MLKCRASSGCGRGITWTETSSPTVDAVSAPASVAAFTAPTSPVIVTETSPSPTSCRPTIVTLAALTMASPAARAATYPLVSIRPIALSAIAHSFGSWIWIDRADDQCVERRRLAGEPGRRHRALDDEHALSHPAAEHVEGDEPLAAAFGLHFEEGAVGQLGQAARGPDVPDHRCGQHQRSFSIGTPLARARSLASGVSTAPRPSTSRSPACAAALTTRSVTAPRSMRRTAADSPPRSF